MLKHSFETKVYYFDTDCYNIVWHGTYLKWLEMGRVEFFRIVGVDLDELNQADVLLPMINLNIKYKSPARFGDTIITTTSLNTISKCSIKFDHTIVNKKDNKVLVTGTTEVVSTNKEGLLYKKIPTIITEKFDILVPS